LSDEFEIVVTMEDGYDRILVIAEVRNEHTYRRDELAQKLIRELRNGTQLRCEVAIRDLGALPRYETKSKKFRDLRRTHAE
jgi:phenylacetate-coenzyme A ligase PaaK-like adenylate-forming protein